MVSQCRAFVILIVVLTSFDASQLCATSISTAPLDVRLVGEDKFIAYEARDTLSLYSLDTGNKLHAFAIGGADVTSFDISADGTLLFVGCPDGTVGVWNVESGQALWTKAGSVNRMDHVYDVNFARNGSVCIAATYQGRAVVFNTLTGKDVSEITFPPMQTHILSAALSPDGKSGVLIELGETIHLFDVATGRMKATGLRGAWPIRYSADGKHFACRSNNSGSQEQLRVVEVSALHATDVGDFRHIGHIKAVGDDGFLVCAYVAEDGDVQDSAVGATYVPGDEKIEEMWRQPISVAHGNRIDFDIDSLLGVSTDHRMITRILNLKDGSVKGTVDNSANYKPVVISQSWQPVGIWFVGGVLAILALVSVVVIVWMRRRQIRS